MIELVLKSREMISELRTIGVRTHLQRGAVLALTRRTLRLIRRVRLATALLVAAVAQPVHAAGGGQTKFQRMSTQFIAALGDPDATSGRTLGRAMDGLEKEAREARKGLWVVDPAHVLPWNGAGAGTEAVVS